jgi:hypothetical protein
VSEGKRAAKATRQVKDGAEIKRKYRCFIAKHYKAGRRSRAMQPERQQDKTQNTAASQH